MATNLLARATGERSDRRIQVVIAKREYEAWFLAAAESIAASKRIEGPVSRPDDPEAIRDAKGRLSAILGKPHAYQPVRDQAALTAVFDLEEAPPILTLVRQNVPRHQRFARVNRLPTDAAPGRVLPDSAESADSVAVRADLLRTLDLDLVGPGPEGEHAKECLPGRERPSLWYLTGFLVPTDTPAEFRADDDGDDDFEAEVPEDQGLAEESTEDRKAARKSFYPSSMGLSVLVRQGNAESPRHGELGRLRAFKRERRRGQRC